MADSKVYIMKVLADTWRPKAYLSVISRLSFFTLTNYSDLDRHEIYLTG